MINDESTRATGLKLQELLRSSQVISEDSDELVFGNNYPDGAPRLRMHLSKQMNFHLLRYKEWRSGNRMLDIGYEYELNKSAPGGWAPYRIVWNTYRNESTSKEPTVVRKYDIVECEYNVDIADSI